MTQPQVTITTTDGALGVLPPSAGKLFALLGVSSSGPTDTPATYARVKDVVADFGPTSSRSTGKLWCSCAPASQLPGFPGRW